MGVNNENENTYQRIDPEDYLDYEDRFVPKGGVGGKAQGSGKGAKTLKAIKSHAKQASAADRKKTLEARLRKFLEGFSIRDENKLTRYFHWVEINFPGGNRLDPDELEIVFSRSGGPGGQNVNRRETRVALLHRPTGIRVVNDQTRSQRENRRLAEERLQERLQEHLQDWRTYLGGQRTLDLTLVKDLVERG